ncbi:MAG: SDR family NAD(P)-dependent oxidoreductase [Rhodothalassiaceae bacterium]
MQTQGLAAIVTGGASGLGAATARRFAAAGMKVAILDRDGDRGPALADEIKGLFLAADVTDEAAVVSAIDTAAAAHGVARVLVNCAGIGPAAKTVSRGEPHDYDLFRKVIAINLVGSFNCIRLFAARLVAADALGEERGVIINTASVAAFDGQIGQAAYSASKGGIVGMTLPIARDLADKQIRVMTIAPGLFATPLLMGLPEEVRESLARSVPHPHRLGDPSEYAALAQHIVENPMLNGETIRLDGAIRMAPR